MFCSLYAYHSLPSATLTSNLLATKFFILHTSFHLSIHPSFVHISQILYLKFSTSSFSYFIPSFVYSSTVLCIIFLLRFSLYLKFLFSFRCIPFLYDVCSFVVLWAVYLSIMFFNLLLFSFSLFSFLVSVCLTPSLSVFFQSPVGHLMILSESLAAAGEWPEHRAWPSNSTNWQSISTHPNAIMNQISRTLPAGIIHNYHPQQISRRPG